MKNRVAFYLICMLLFLSGCAETSESKVEKLVREWSGRTITFPDETIFISGKGDTVGNGIPKSDFYIFTYVDSVGCVSCKLQLERWKQYMVDLRKNHECSVTVLFFMGSTEWKYMKPILQRSNFVYPICFDKNDSINKLNHFSTNMAFQTFLLDRNYKVLSIGNPIHSPKVKDLYNSIIQGKIIERHEYQSKTKMLIEESVVSLGRFNWKKEKKAVFKIKNIGHCPLVIYDVATSCGCTSVDYPKEPVRPGESVSLQVTYKADHPEHFDKTITVYCNANPSLVRLKITGDAE